ncbi:MAG: nucleoside-diphosphate kinase [Alphaproteobacteria bacterium]
MAIERTLSLIKPDATIRNLSGSINKIIEENGLKIIAQKRLKLTKNQAEAFYAEHKGKEFFEALVTSMIKAHIVAQVLEGEDAIATYRKLMGPTDPKKQTQETIRKQFGIDYRQNSVHGSDSKESAVKEITFFFSQLELVD